MILASLIKELKLLGHDLHGLAVLFVLPVAFMLIMSVALSRDADPHINSHIVLVGAADNGLNADFAAALREVQIAVDTLPESDLTQAQAALRQGRYQMLVHNPNAAAAALADEQPLQLQLPPDTEPSWLLAMKGVLRQHYTATRLNAYFAAAKAEPVHVDAVPAPLRTTVNNAVAEATRSRFDVVGDYLARPVFAETYISRAGEAVEKPNSVQHSVPAWLVFGMFFIMIPLSNVMALERQTNTITRLRLARAPATTLVAAKLLPYFLINQLQFVVMLLLGRYLLPLLGVPPLLLNGPLWPYALLAVAVSLAALGYALLVSVLAKSTEHAVVLGGGGIIIMAALGGIMVPAYVMPEAMQALARLSPMAWGLDAFQQLLLNRAGVGGIAAYLQLLLLFAAACLLLAVWLYRRQLATQVRF